MSDIDEKLQRGFALLDRAGADEELAGVALLAFHGALEDYLRDALLAHPALSDEQRRLLADRQLGWRPMAELAQEHLGLAPEDAQTILRTNRRRQSFAHGGGGGFSIPEVRRYGRFAAALMGREEGAVTKRRPATEPIAAPPADEPAPAPRRAPRPAPAAGAAIPEAAAAAQAMSLRSAQRRRRSSGSLFQGPYGWAALGLAALLVLVFGTWSLLGRGDEGRAGSIAPPRSPVLPTATPTPATTPTPSPRAARMVGLPGGIGTLRAQPSFTAPELTTLTEGQAVVLLDPSPVPAEGTDWLKIQVGTHVGWQPANNVQLAP